MGLWQRSFLTLTFLWGLVFALGMAVIYIISMMYGQMIPTEFQAIVIFIPVIFALFVVFLQWLISPWIMDLTLRWIYDLDKYKVEQLPHPEIKRFLQKQMAEHNFSLKYVAVIHDNNPNAFVFGHTRKRARMVITEGILTLLDQEEQLAVVGHECGHIVHRDMIWMTIAAAVPLVTYSFYQGLMTFARLSMRSDGGDDDAAQVGAIAVGIAIMAWIVYYISHFGVLFLSRVREYYADEFSSDVTDQPGALSRALVKIAYGMVKSQGEKEAKIADSSYEKDERRRLSKQTAFAKGLRPLGIFDVNMANSLVMSAYGRGRTDLDEDAVAKAAAWDLNNPWAGFLELQSTHPLPAKRIKALNKIQAKRGLKEEFPTIGEIKPPESLWDEFFIDLFLMFVVPSLVIILPPIGAGLAILAGFNPLVGVGGGLLVFAFFYWLRRREKYPKMTRKNPVTTVEHCLTDMTKNSYYEVSPLRGKPAVLEGKVIGRGIPGYYLSEDLVIQDKTGILTLDYNPIFGFMSWIFALFRVSGLKGKTVRAYGWFHRGPGPYLTVWRIETPSGTYKNRWAGLNTIINWFILLLALAFIIVGLFPNQVATLLGSV